MMRCLAVLCLLIPPALHAQQNAGVRYTCWENSPRIEIEYSESQEALDQKTGTTEWIDPSALVEYSAEDAHGNVWRTGSTSLIRQCGEFRLRVEGGYFNHKIQGEMGAADDFAIVEITDAQGGSSGRLAIGTCHQSFTRYSSVVECPRDWATKLKVFRSSASGNPDMLISLDHQYEEFRKPIPVDESDPARQP